MLRLLVITFISWGMLLHANAQQPSRPKQLREIKDSILADYFTQKLIWSDTIPDGMSDNKFFNRQVCKGVQMIYLVMPRQDEIFNTIAINSTLPIQSIIKERKSLIKITGNILYDVNYRSRIDTPYAESNVFQHTLQTRIDGVYKDQYPFRFYLTTRFSNSDLFRKYTDLNFQYNQTDFKRMLKTKATEAIESYVNSKTDQLDSLKRIIDNERLAIAGLRQSINRPDLSQKIVEEREKIFSKNQ